MVSIRAAFLLPALLCLTSNATMAEDLSPSQMAVYEQGFSAVQKTTRTFRADLRQSLHLQGVAQPIVSTGTLFYQTPDRLLLRFSQPAGEWFLINGSVILIQKKGEPLKTMSANPGGVRSHAASLLDFFHSGAERWSKDFDVKMARDGDHLVVRLKPWLTPTSTSQGVSSITTTLQLPGYDVLEIEVSMNEANRIDYQFIHGLRNVPIDSQLFSPPSQP